MHREAIGGYAMRWGCVLWRRHLHGAGHPGSLGSCKSFHEPPPRRGMKRWTWPCLSVCSRTEEVLIPPPSDNGTTARPGGFIPLPRPSAGCLVHTQRGCLLADFHSSLWSMRKWILSAARMWEGVSSSRTRAIDRPRGCSLLSSLLQSSDSSPRPPR